MNKIKRLLGIAAMTLAPCLAVANTLPPFVEGMEFTLRQGEESSFTFDLDPCAGSGGNCHLYSYYGGGWTAYDSNTYWDAVGGSGYAGQCPNDRLCMTFWFWPATVGHWDFFFDTTYEEWFYLGGDDSGPPFVHTEEGYISHYFSVTVVPAAVVPLPAAGLAFGSALAGLGLLWRRRRSA